MWKLNLNKSPTYKDALIAAAKLSQGEMVRYFYFILAFWWAALATDVNFCIRWWCFFPSPTWLDFYRRRVFSVLSIRLFAQALMFERCFLGKKKTNDQNLKKKIPINFYFKVLCFYTLFIYGMKCLRMQVF